MMNLTFDMHRDDVFMCTADVGWITGMWGTNDGLKGLTDLGHSYIVYGPLCNGITTVLFESLPTFPTPSRYWETIDKHRVTHFYTAPTAIRSLKKLGDQHVLTSSLATLRVLGSVGEPIDPEVGTFHSTIYINFALRRGRGSLTLWEEESAPWWTLTGRRKPVPSPSLLTQLLPPPNPVPQLFLNLEWCQPCWTHTAANFLKVSHTGEVGVFEAESAFKVLVVERNVVDIQAMTSRVFCASSNRGLPWLALFSATTIDLCKPTFLSIQATTLPAMKLFATLTVIFGYWVEWMMLSM